MGVMGQKERVVDRVSKLLDLARVFQLPVILTEQNPQFLGATLPAVQESLPGYEPIEKVHFDCCAVDAFNNVIENKGLRNIILTGVETHICVFQTCVSLLERGFRFMFPTMLSTPEQKPTGRSASPSCRKPAPPSPPPRRSSFKSSRRPVPQNLRRF